MRTITLSVLAIALIAGLFTQLVEAQSGKTSGAALHFVAEFASQPEGADKSLTLNVTFYGQRLETDKIEEALRSCLRAAVAIQPDKNITAMAWYNASLSEEGRESVTLTNGASSLLYTTKDQSISPVADGQTTNESGQDESDGLSAIMEHSGVLKSCKGFPQDRVSAVVTVAAQDRGRERKLILKAMRVWCRENDVTIDRKFQSCISAISRAVIATNSTASSLPADLPAAIVRGKKAYQTGQCAKCHQINGRGGRRGPSLVDSTWDHCDGSIDGIRKVLVSGVPSSKVKDPNRNSGMNSATNLVPDDKDLTDLAIYVHSLSQ